MRRSDREITDKKEIYEIIKSSQVCHLAFAQGGHPYIVPLCFGLHENTLYFHSAPEGRKVDLLRQNPEVCFEFDTGCELVLSDDPCRIGMNYRSVIGFGEAQIVTDPEEKKTALESIMLQYVGKTAVFPEEALNRTLVFKVDIKEVTGKKAQR